MVWLAYMGNVCLSEVIQVGKEFKIFHGVVQKHLGVRGTY